MNFLVYEKILPNGIFRVFNQKPDNVFLSTKQVHSNLVIDEKNLNDFKIVEADGISGTSKNPKCILTADCLPIVLEGNFGHVALHAGWKGIKDRIIENQNVKIIQPHFAFIGPHISSLNYEVQSDFLENFPQSNSIKQIGNKFYFDLSHEISTQLKNSYPNIEILDCRLCTFDDNNFHSYRRNKTTNRNYNIYFPNGEKQ